tara:strand:- start:728 stop:1078 length:351 start_codon:yes stop_codon:yes gene_type:complete
MSTKLEKSYVAFSSKGQDLRHVELEVTTDMIAEFIGRDVCVSWVKDPDLLLAKLRKNFETQISVQGKLEGGGEIGRFRVLLNDDTYSYFYDDCVWMLGYDGEKQVTDKQRPVIFIN